jgi:hypothetical protein
MGSWRHQPTNDFDTAAIVAAEMGYEAILKPRKLQARKIPADPYGEN